MKRTRLIIGDVFETPLGNDAKRYFQFIAIDDNQLSSDVIRVFSTKYSKAETPELDDVVDGSVDFYAHCVVKAGIKYDFWRKVGHVEDVGPIDVIFRST